MTTVARDFALGSLYSQHLLKKVIHCYSSFVQYNMYKLLLTYFLFCILYFLILTIQCIEYLNNLYMYVSVKTYINIKLLNLMIFNK